MRLAKTLDAGLIHDIKNLLTVISANCSIFAESLPKKNASQAANICEAVMYLDSMLTSFQSGTESLAMGCETDVHVVISEATELISASFPRVSYCSPRASNPLWFAIDRGDLFRLLMNLLSNASEAACVNQSRAPLVRVSVDPESASISVADSGKGFEGIAHEAAFKPFVSDRKRSTRQHQGLGLFVVRAITQMYGGDVSISQVDEMNQVTVRFPSKAICKRCG